MLLMAIRRIALSGCRHIGWADEGPAVVRSMNPFPYIARPAMLNLDFYETSGFRAGRSVEHNVDKHIHYAARLVRVWMCVDV